MTKAGAQHHLEGFVRSGVASLRVVGLAYAGLGGMLALGLVISVAFMPVAPALEQVTQPARQMAAGLVPATDAVVNLIGGPGLTRMPVTLVRPPPVAAAAALPPESDVSPLAGADAIVDDEQLATNSSPAQHARLYVAVPLAAVAPVTADESLLPADETGLVGEPEPRLAVREPAPVEQPIVLPAERQAIQAANEAPARPLPPLPRPTDTPLQVKARVDADNQAAIDAARAAQVRAKLEADVANQAAIDARQASEALATATARNGGLTPNNPQAASATAASAPSAATSVAPPLAAQQATEPTVIVASRPAPTSGPQTRAAADAANQAVIDTNKLTQARARALANDANQNAIATGRAARSPITVTPTPAPATVQPTPVPTPAPTAIATELPTPPGPVVEMQAPTSVEADELSRDDGSAPDDAPPPAGSDDA